MSADPYIETRDAWVEFPIFDAKTRSLKKTFLGKAGGAIGRNTENVVVIEALRDISLQLRLGDRVGARRILEQLRIDRHVAVIGIFVTPVPLIARDFQRHLGVFRAVRIKKKLKRQRNL